MRPDVTEATMPISREELTSLMVSSHKLAQEAFPKAERGVTPDGLAAMQGAYGAMIMQTAMWDDVNSSDIAAVLKQEI
jgi:hypothetical protein